ncbi:MULTISPECIES: TetR/AcrR family transcriptional regulator [Priestia]|uniref:TetR/AcrR family transcriptional regulator n=1 Tax=Priestia TaxID=2800373 RepID=UPI00138F5108|nr:helix-turn-helix domain-containing protein [Priestia megaterium]MEB2266611.1 TetR/AcrR family transcriptional regulator [Priestia megaterium]NEW01550.1 helix-turn-helix transcriptional regulator [Priestia megaterium]
MNQKQLDILGHTHQLFMEKGYVDTSVQDILERSGISKGTFYKYFSSKSELLLSLLSSLQESLILQREKVAIEYKGDNQKVFEEQIIFMLNFAEQNKIPEMIESTLILNEIKTFQYIEELKTATFNWIYERLQQIFPSKTFPYLFDGAVLLEGMLNNIFKMNKALNYPLPIEQIVRYCMKRIEEIVIEIAEQKEQLFNPSVYSAVFNEKTESHFSTELTRVTAKLKRVIENKLTNEEEQKKSLEFVTFISDELLQNDTEPRTFIIQSSLLSLEKINTLAQTKELEEYKEVITTLTRHAS